MWANLISFNSIHLIRVNASNTNIYLIFIIFRRKKTFNQLQMIFDTRNLGAIWRPLRPLDFVLLTVCYFSVKNGQGDSRSSIGHLWRWRFSTFSCYWQMRRFKNFFPGRRFKMIRIDFTAQRIPAAKTSFVKSFPSNWKLVLKSLRNKKIGGKPISLNACTIIDQLDCLRWDSYYHHQRCKLSAIYHHVN